jgi:ribonuclease P protein component
MERPFSPVPDQQFPKKERLTSKKKIEELFKKGSSVYLYPFRLQFLPGPPADGARPEVLFSVSKRYFKRAVDRNTIRRRMREAYRTSRAGLLAGTPPDKVPAVLAWVYTAKEPLPFDMLKKKLILVWQRMLLPEEPPKSSSK